jgi:hypothetical protein
MSTSDFSSALAGLDELFKRVEAGAARGLAAGADALEADAQGATVYRDVSGATRASTVAYVAWSQDDGSGAAAAALAAGEAKNPGRGVRESADIGGQDQVVVVLTAMMDYDADLETRRAGAQAFLGPALDQHAGQLLAAAGRGIAEELN